MAKFIDQKLVLELFNYNKETGLLSVKSTRGYRGSVKKGRIIGSIHRCGSKNTKKHYLRTSLLSSLAYVHRIIWVMVTGEQPIEIDHIDGDGLNNKWENLRNVNHSVNGKNQKAHKNNTSGISGITFRKDSGKWRARIMVNDKSISLGTFSNKDDAISARVEAESTYWYS